MGGQLLYDNLVSLVSPKHFQFILDDISAVSFRKPGLYPIEKLPVSNMAV